MIYGESYKGLDYSISVGHRGAKEWESPNLSQEGESFSVKYFGVSGIYNIPDGSSMSLSLRYADAENVISRVCKPKTTFISFRYDKQDFWARLFYNNHEKTFWSDTYGVKDSNYELEIFKSLRRGKNIISFGGLTRRTNWAIDGKKGEKAGITEEHTVRDSAINVENEYHLNDQ